MPRSKFDAVVVGAGLSGSWIAKELCEAGRNVALLDAGPLLPVHLFGENNPPRNNGGVWRLFRALGGQHVQTRSAVVTPQTSRLYVSDRENPYESTGSEAFLWLRGRQVGGRGHVWGRVAMRFGPTEFNDAAHPESQRPWPTSYEELEPYYAEVERTLKVSQHQPPPARVAEAGAGNELAFDFAECARSLFRERVVERLRLAAYEPGPLSPMLTAALATNRLTLLPNTIAENVLMDGRGDPAGVRTIDARTCVRNQLEGEHVFLCASTIETLRVLLNSRSQRHPRGLGNSSGLLGTGVMDHPSTVAVWSARWRRRSRPRVSDLLALGSESGVYVAASRDAEPVDRFGIQVYLRPDRVTLRAFGEMRPRRDNTVTLGTRRDRWGVPIVRIAISHRGEEDVLLRNQSRVLRQLMAALPVRAGSKLAGSLVVAAQPAGAAAHECGGAPMGSDAMTSVVNGNNRVWDAPNVWVCDGACFPTSGYQNISLTIMALALRAARCAAGKRDALGVAS